jgi:serine/threonine-protein kinase
VKEKDAKKGKKVGPYKFLEEIGKGGMAQVYRGLHETLEREVAIKELLPRAANDKDSVSRFRREALALATFRHQNIVTVYDLVEKNGAQFLILEYVDGPTLLELLKDGPLPPIVAAVVAEQLASALEHAHFHRIIHRDLKPGNVMLTGLGEVKLMDFGIARDEELGSLTKTGMAVGTPSYMSPEQVTGGAIDQRTDVYSLGAVLYECLSALRAFSGQSAGEIFARVRDGRFKPLAKIAPEIPSALARVVKRAMQTKSGHRYSGAAEMRRDLEAFIAGQLRTSGANLLMAFLHCRGKLSEKAALEHVTAAELESMKRLDARTASSAIMLEPEPTPPPPRRGGVRWLLGGLVLATAGVAAWLHPLWWPSVLPLLTR